MDKNYILHHKKQYKCDDWNLNAEDMIHPQCHLVSRDKLTLSLCNHKLQFHSYFLSPPCQKQRCHTDLNRHVVPAKLICLHRHLVDLLTKKCMNSKIESISGDNGTKHCFYNITGQFMSHPNPVYCACNLLIISQTRI